MLSEEQLKEKLRRRAKQFSEYYYQGKYITAKGIYNQVFEVATFLQMDQEFIEELLGGYDEATDDYAPGIMDRKLFWKIDKKCCEARNKEYEDRAMRRIGQPVRYYSDITYCSICEKNKEP